MIRELGFTPIDSPAREFALPDIDSKDKPVALSRFRGEWIWLVFWATWCPACNQQLPGLEGLHEEFAAKGLALLGIATDNGSSQEVKDHVTRKGINFTILHDRDGAVAGRYQASAIPTMYLISPDFRLVGLARGVLHVGDAGAREALAKLLSIKKVAPLDTHGAPSLPVEDGDGKVPLAQDLKPPTLKMELNPAQPVAGESATLDVTVTWSGDLGAYLFKVPKLTLPDKITLGPFAALSSSRDGKASIVYRAPLAADAPGEYAIGPVELSFGARSGAGSFQSTRGNTLRFTVAQSFIQRMWPILAALVGMAGVLAAGVALIMQRRMRRAGDTGRDSARKSQREKIVAEHQRIGRIRLQGDMAKYSLELVVLLQKLLVTDAAGSHDPEWGDLNKFLEKIRYGGYELDKNQMARFEQKVSELLERL